MKMTTAPGPCIVLISLWLSLPGCGNRDMSSAWMPEAVTIDGNAADWILIPTKTIKNPEMTLALCNDAAALYGLAVIDNPMVAARIIDKGIILWLQRETREKAPVGIRFQHRRISGPDSLQASHSSPETMPSLRPRPARQDTIPLDQISIIQEHHSPTALNALPDMPAGILLYNHGTLVMELRIPLLRTAHPYYRFYANPGERINIGLQLEPPGTDARQTKKGVTGIRNIGSGAPEIHSPGNGESDMPAEDQAVWITTTLADYPDTSIAAAEQ